jgi:hypothetical protein
LVYRGTLGTTGTTALDPVDDTWAIAVCTVTTPGLTGTLPTATEGIAYSGTITSVLVSNPTYAVMGGSLPDGVSMDNSGNITGTPRMGSAGHWLFTVTVTDGTTGATFSEEFKLDVQDQSGYEPPACRDCPN